MLAVKAGGSLRALAACKGTSARCTSSTCQRQRRGGVKCHVAVGGGLISQANIVRITHPPESVTVITSCNLGPASPSAFSSASDRSVKGCAGNLSLPVSYSISTPPSISRKCTSRGKGREGIALEHRNFLQRESLRPVVLCPYLCSSDFLSLSLPLSAPL